MRRLLCSTTLALFSFTGGKALAQSAQQPAQPSEPSGERSFLQGEKLTGDWAGIRSDMKKSGLSLDATYTQEYLGVAGGGLRRRGVYDSLLELDLQLDLAALTHDRWKGGSLHASGLVITGPSLSARDIGNEGNVSNINFRNSARLFELWFEQEAFDGAFALRVGQLAADVEFATTQTGAVFINSDFGALPAASFNVTPPIYPTAAPGVRLKLKPAKAWYLQAAVFDGNPNPDELGDPSPGFRRGTQYNDSGTRVNLNSKEGALTLFETGVSIYDPDETTGPDAQNGQTAPAPAPKTHGLPGKYKLGGFYHSDTFTDYRSGRGVQGNRGWYAIADQMVWRKQEKQGAYLYARAGGAQSDRSVLDYAFDTGLNLLGLIPGRDADVFGLGFAYNHYSSGFSSAGLSAGDSARGHESILEVTYRAQLTPSFTLQPDLQYVSHPAGRTDTENALVIGVRSAITF